MEFKISENEINGINEKGEVMARITYKQIEDGVYNIDHTFVDESLRGQKIAQKLVELAIKEIEKKNGKVVATCSYARHYLEKHGYDIA
ncbi:MAG: N-acetyltransferase [Clostridia bacterium]|nr:N-acetyltransferase [Clostridia bacterium]